MVFTFIDSLIQDFNNKRAMPGKIFPMKKVAKCFIVFLLLSFLFSCSTINKQLRGVWVVEEFKIDGKEVMWEQVKVNMTTFSYDGTCSLPIRDLSKRDLAKWKVVKQNGSYVLSITEAQDSIFNGLFTIQLSKRTQGDAIVNVLQLNSPKLYMQWSQ